MKKKLEVKDEDDVRNETLAIRISKNDRRDLQRLRVKLSPYAPLSAGKAISVAIKIALEKLG